MISSGEWPEKDAEVFYLSTGAFIPDFFEKYTLFLLMNNIGQPPGINSIHHTEEADGNIYLIVM